MAVCPLSLSCPDTVLSGGDQSGWAGQQPAAESPDPNMLLQQIQQLQKTVQQLQTGGAGGAAAYGGGAYGAAGGYGGYGQVPGTQGYSNYQVKLNISLTFSEPKWAIASSETFSQNSFCYFS